MSLAAVVDDLGAYLTGAVTPAPPLIGIAAPVVTADLPALRLSVRDVRQALGGIGALPMQSMTGALLVSSDIDLTDPRLVFADGVVPLLSDDRRTLSLPHGPVVRADGTISPGPWQPSDITVTVAGVDRTVATDSPSGTQAQLLEATATLVFADPLPAIGSVHVSYHIGQWDVRAHRYQGTLDVDIYATDAAAIGLLRRSVEDAFESGPAGARLVPVAVGPVAALDPSAANSLMATSSFSFDLERVVALLPNGGGVITLIDVQPNVDTTPVESFAVPAGSSR